MTDSQMWTIIGTIAVMFLGAFSGFYALLRSEIRVLEVQMESVKKDILTEMRVHVAEHHKP